jgi:hypothetical protein
MLEDTRGTLVLEGRLDEEMVERAIAAAEELPAGEQVAAGLGAVITFAEAEPEAARAALWELRGDGAALTRLEACLGGNAERATLALGAAIQLASAELASPAPDLRSRMPELLRWLEGAW